MLPRLSSRYADTAAALALIAAMVLLAPARAQTGPTSTTIAYQGVLLDDGSPVADGSYALTIGLFASPTGGTAVYAETHTVTTTGGVFSLAVGGGTATSGIFEIGLFRNALWVDVALGGTSLSPRTAIQATPYALSLRPGAFVQGDVGVRAEAEASTGFVYGLYGAATSSTGTTYGVYGSNASPSGSAVYGIATATSGQSHGVNGQTEATSGAGVFGSHTAPSGFGSAIRGVVSSSDGFAGSFQGGRGIHVNGSAEGGSSAATVSGENSSTGDGVAAFFKTRGTGSTITAMQSGSGDIIQAYSVDEFLSLRFRVEQDGDVWTDGTFTSSGADFAEWLPLASSSQPPRAGDVVGVTRGRVGLATDAAEQVMVVSSNPAFIGNPDAADGGALVALVGQVEVRLASPATVGDLLVASGREDGTARPVLPARYDPGMDGAVIGRVLALAGTDRAVALVGIDEAAALRKVLIQQQFELATLRRELDATRDRQQNQIDALMARLDALDRQPEAPDVPLRR